MARTVSRRKAAAPRSCGLRKIHDGMTGVPYQETDHLPLHRTMFRRSMPMPDGALRRAGAWATGVCERSQTPVAHAPGSPEIPIVPLPLAVPALLLDYAGFA